MVDTQAQAETKLKTEQDPGYDDTSHTVMTDSQTLTYFYRARSLNIRRMDVKTQTLRSGESKALPVREWNGSSRDEAARFMTHQSRPSWSLHGGRSSKATFLF